MLQASFSFAADECGRLSEFKFLESGQQSHVDHYDNNQLLRLARSDSLHRNAQLQQGLLDVLQAWSDHFQQLIRIRAESTTRVGFADLADAHLREEIGHNRMLSAMRGNRSVNFWDPVIEGAYSWFADRMAHGSAVESTILMHMVIEKAGDIFYGSVASVFPGDEYFQHHNNHDGDHAAAGLQVLKRHSKEPVEQMIKTLDQGWAMMELLCNRMADLAYDIATSPKIDNAPRTKWGSELPPEIWLLHMQL